MDQRDFITFLKVAETSSVTLAADVLGRSQPSVTRCIQDLEKALGFALFERIGRRISLTPEGIAFEEESRRMLAMFEDLPVRTKARAGQMEIPLTISATSALGTGLLPHAIARWPQAERPKDIQLMLAAPNAVAQDLRSGNARIGFASLPLDVPGITAERAFSAPLVAAMPESRAAEFPVDVPVSLAQAVSETLVTLRDQARLQGRIKQALDAAGLRSERVVQANSTLAALQFVSLLGATAIVEPITAYGATPPGVILRPLAERIEFSFGFLLGGSAGETRETQVFFDHCEATLHALIPQVRRLDTDDSFRTQTNYD